MPVPPKFKAGCGVVLVFASGVLCGIIGIFLLIAIVVPKSEGWKQNESKEFLARHLGNRLKLSEAKAKELRPGFDRFLEKRWTLRSEYVENDAILLKEYLDEIESELSPDQVVAARKILNRWLNNKRNQLPAKKVEAMKY